MPEARARDPRERGGMGNWSACCSPGSRPACWRATATCWPRAQGSDAIVVDPGQRAMGPLRRILDENRLTPAAVLLTHGHIDHIWSAQKVADTYGCPALHPPRGPLHADRPDPGLRPPAGPARARARCSASPSRWSSSTATATCSTWAASPSTVDHTPGHTRGSVVFRVGRRASARAGRRFTGDTLFKQSVGPHRPARRQRPRPAELDRRQNCWCSTTTPWYYRGTVERPPSASSAAPTRSSKV